MKKIDFDKMIKDNSLNVESRLEVLGMEFIRRNDGNYLLKNSGGRIVSEKEKLQLEKNELILKDFKSNNCQEKSAKEIKEIDKKLEKESDTKDENIKKARKSKK